MKKKMSKMIKILLLVFYAFYEFVFPIQVMAETIAKNPTKGDVGISEHVSDDGGHSVTVVKSSTNDTSADGNILITKTVSKTDTEGVYEVLFRVEGNDVTSTTESTKDSYTVFVLDASKSMDCSAGANNSSACISGVSTSNKNTPWDKAIEAAINFSSAFAAKGDNNNLALVTFNSSGYQKRTFKNSSDSIFTTSNFGSTSQGTNYNAGLNSAYSYFNTLSSEIKKNASLNIIFISDGEPNGSSYANTLSNLKNMGVNIYTFAYNLSETTDKVAYNTLKGISTDNKVTSITLGNIDEILASFVSKVTISSPAGTDAILTDNLGIHFTVNSTDGVHVVGDKVQMDVGSITEQGTTISFLVSIDKDNANGWVNVNEGFSLNYKDALGDVQELHYSKDEEQPQVYWEREQYRYIVNYYKDSIDDNNLIATDTRSAVHNTIIDINSVEKDKYLTMLEGYQFDSITPNAITVTNRGEVQVINVLYTKKLLSYVVNYYYDDEIFYTINEVTDYGTSIDSQSYYLSEKDIKEGYVLDTNKSDTNTYMIKNDNIVINIYYKKNSYDYTIKYHFNDKIDDNYTKSNSALFDSVINAVDYYLSQNDLKDKYTDYFLDESNQSNFEEVRITSGSNQLNLFYVNTNFTDENIVKTSNTDKVSDENGIFDYTIHYHNEIKNVPSNSTILVSIVDYLPYEILEDESNLSGGIYSKEDKTITWTYTELIDKYKISQEIDQNITISLVFKNLVSINELDNRILTNTATGQTIVNQIASKGVEDKSDVEIELKGDLEVTYESIDGVELAKKNVSSDDAGCEYKTEALSIFGYTLTEVPSNQNGKYVANTTIYVKYIYTKNDGDIVKDAVIKTGPEFMDDINGIFNYTLTYEGRIENYVGKAVLTLIDELPYEILEDKSSYDDRCVYQDGKIQCIVEYDITENTDLSENFELHIAYQNIDTDSVVNTVLSRVELDNNQKDNKDKVSTTIYGRGGSLEEDDPEEVTVFSYVEVMPPKTGVNDDGQNYFLVVIITLFISLFGLVSKIK